MKMELRRGESIDIEFELAEQVFQIVYGGDGRISIILQAGFELHPAGPDDFDEKIIVYKN